jgi:chemotaxis family two-component system response regulator Rcp1
VDPKLVQVLLVDDDAGDAELAQRAAASGNVPFAFTIVDDGVNALNYLRRQPPFSDARQPDFLILDMNLPRMNGPEVLQEMRKDASLAKLPVFIFSTSEVLPDFLAQNRLESNHCFVKPLRFVDYIETMKTIHRLYVKETYSSV